jgi:uncharacterized protein YjeT (DUF2065 family)
MSQQLLIGLCLVIIFEGLLLFAAPRAWQRFALELAQADPNRLRAGGGIAVIIGMLLLQAAV